MSDMVYLYVGYTVVWLGLLLYVVKLHLIQRRLQKDIRMLKEMLDDKER